MGTDPRLRQRWLAGFDLVEWPSRRSGGRSEFGDSLPQAMVLLHNLDGTKTVNMEREGPARRWRAATMPGAWRLET